MHYPNPGRKFWIAYVLVVAVAVSAAIISAQTSLPVSRPAAGELSAAALRDAGIQLVIAGKFDEGIATLTKAVKADPADKNASAALAWVESFMSDRVKAQAARDAEYQADVRRVRLSMVAQAYLPKLENQAGTVLRDKAAEISKTYAAAPNSDTLEEGSAAGVGELKSKQQAAAQTVLKLRGEATAALADDKSDYMKALRETLDDLAKRLAPWNEAWSALSETNGESRGETAAALRPLEEQLSEALADLETLVATEPWRIGLSQARLAKQVATEPEKIAEQDWYRAIVKEVEARGKKAIEEARWYDALAAYAGLHDLDPESTAYEQAVKDVRSHVRVLRFYGVKNDASAGSLGMPRRNTTGPSSAASEPAGETPEEDVSWRELVAGIDADMVRSAVARVGDFYVSGVDYPKVAAGGLRALKVLAETPQAGHSFRLLADDDKRRSFVAAIERQIESITAQDHPDATSIIYAFNAVLRASERTVEIPTAVLCMEFTDGLLDELDPFSNMVWPHDVADFNKQTIGKFYGVGIQITKEPGEPLKVVTPLPKSPAMRANIKAGDSIMAVDGRRTEDLTVDKLVDMIMGEQGTSVKLLIKRRGLIDPFEVSIVREQISISTVKGWRQLDDDGQWDYFIDHEARVAYIRVTQFTDQTPGEVNSVLREVRRIGGRSVILDLRFNPGGLLKAAAVICDDFLRRGRIVFTSGRAAEKTEIHATAPGTYLDGDLIVLVNEHSASAAEIVAGALKDLGRATIIGTRSYGKGSVQQVYQIPSHKGYLKLTTAHYRVGDTGKLVHRTNGAKEWGVDPDLAVSMSPRQMERWLKIRRKTDLPQEDLASPQVQADLAAQLAADTQLSAALLVARLKQVAEPVVVAKD